MHYTRKRYFKSTGDFPECFMIPHGLEDFFSAGTVPLLGKDGRRHLVFLGDIDLPVPSCPNCKAGMYINGVFPTTLRHVPFGGELTFISFDRNQYRCPVCGKTQMEKVPFRADHHRISTALQTYAEDLLKSGLTNKQVAMQTGLAQCTVKAIDKDRLRREYTEGGEGENSRATLKRPSSYARLLSIDEFKLHNNHRYATHIIDLETGHILWIAHGKGKQVVYDFIDHVGEAWMSHVEAIACDMNSDFQEAFESRCAWVQPVFDRFHIIKNFNEKVISEVRRDEQKRLMDAGQVEAAKALKHTRYILTSNRSTLERKDKEAEESADTAKQKSQERSVLFRAPERKRHGGYVAKYEALLQENKLLNTMDIVKEQLLAAYTETSEAAMAKRIDEIIETCSSTGNRHFKWFARLLKSHYKGIIAYATFHITSGKIEGINNKIKTLRRQAYGIPDDEYFFLKVIDSSYKRPAHV